MDSLTAKGDPRHPHPPGRPLAMLGPKIYLNDDVARSGPLDEPQHIVNVEDVAVGGAARALRAEVRNGVPGDPRRQGGPS